MERWAIELGYQIGTDVMDILLEKLHGGAIMAIDELKSENKNLKSRGCNAFRFNNNDERVE